MLVAALAFMFAYMAGGVSFLPTLFNLIGLSACVWLLAAAISSLVKFVGAHIASESKPDCATKAISRTERRV
ncbi:hypothetical protein [Brevundimonas sp.]|uniref:hypothetical protein n=2 Tax=unclassified Brevundimonas TaxID=2622653 RepID=UPI0028A0F38A|nr:hypothetical protein [Brevundimonas sp.]